MSASASSNSYKNHHYYSPSRGVRYAPPPPPPHHGHHHHHHHPPHHAYYPPPHHAHHAHPHYSMPPAPPPHAAAMTEHLKAKASRREGEQAKATSHYRSHPHAHPQHHHAHYHRYPHHAYSHPHEYAAWASHPPAAPAVPAPVAPPMAARTAPAAAPQMTAPTPAPATQPPAVVSQAPVSRVLQQLPLPEPIKEVSKESTKNTVDNKQGVFQKSLKSPVTMCFERMLGAADYLATSTVPTPKPAANQNSALGPVQTQVNARPVTAVGNQKHAKENSQVSVRLVEKFSNKQSTPVNFTEKTVSMENATVVSEEKSSNKRSAQEMETTAGSSPSDNPFDEIANDKELHRQVILHMALQRNIGDEAVPRDSVCTNAPLIAIGATNQEAKKVIEDGFYWKDFPVCEAVLYKHMAEYYGVSCVQRQSRMQQYFNKKLVNAVREAALSEGLTFDPSFTEKKLRDRIRCFYKTHLQNAKKRLVTLQKRPNSHNNQAIVRVYVKCVKEGASYEDSVGMIESAKTAPTHNSSNKKSRTEQFATVPVHEV